MNYSIVGLFALIIHLIVNYDVLFQWKKTKAIPAIKALRATCYLAAAFFVTDILWGVFYENGWVVLTSIDTYVFFTIVALIVMGYASYVVTYINEKKVFKIGWVVVASLFAISQIALLIVNLFFYKVLFKFEGKEYIALFGRYVEYGFQALFFFIISLHLFGISFFRKGLDRSKCLAISGFGLIMIASIVGQFFLPLWPIYSIGCVLGFTLVHNFVVIGERFTIEKALEQSSIAQREQQIKLGEIQQLAYTDPLTGVKSKHAFVEKEADLDQLIGKHQMDVFAVVFFDLNDLKEINDKYGHEKGDQYLVDSVALIKKHFPDKDVYRYGGDEFIAILEGESYKERYRIINDFNKEIEENAKNDEGKPVIATGTSDFNKNKDNTFRVVLSRADTNMYSRKRFLKKLQNKTIKQDETDEDFNVSNSDFRTDFYELLTKNGSHSLIDFLNNSSCDEIVEIDLNNDTFKQFYHVDGKYFVPTIDNSYKQLYDYCIKYMVHPDDVEIYIKLMKTEGIFERLRNNKIPNFDFAQFRYKLQNGTYRYAEQCIITGEENGIPPGIFRIYIFDVHNTFVRKLGITANETNVLSGERNNLTGLLNEKFFLLKSDEYLATKKNVNWCLIAIDIERFNYFDQWFGREKGDELLKRIGDELLKYEKKTGSVAGYFGQDDFTLLTKYDEKVIENLYIHIRDLIKTYASSYGFLPSFGIALFDESMTAVDAFDRATIATKKAEKDPTRRILVYNESMQSQAEQEYKNLNILRDAFDNDEFDFYLQPQCRVKTGKIVGAEALARLIKKDGTIVPPGVFVPLLEKYGFVTELDQIIWEKVCVFIKEQLAEKRNLVPISVNVSRLDIINADIYQIITDLVKKYAIPKKYLKIEITESAYMETSSIIETLVKKLRKDGFQVLMDDFGSGYSSLNSLSNLKVDAIKLDAKFLHAEGGNYEKSIHILESVINMAKIIGLPIIVEGVETIEQKGFIEEMGCRYVQGYFFYKPMPKVDFVNIIGDDEKIDNHGFEIKSNEQFRIREFLDKNIYSDSMLNNIIGAVAIYSWHDKTQVDIIRFNQQFYEAVSSKEFHGRLLNIEQWMPLEDRPKMIAALKLAKESKLTGSVEVLRFYREDGLLTSFLMHFYYIGKKEGGERFYGSATNITDLIDLKEERDLISRYSDDNIIFIRRINEKWVYSVASHGLSDVFGLTPKELEEEMNNGRFAQRVTPKKAMKEFMQESEAFAKAEKDFEKVLAIKDKSGKAKQIKLMFTCVHKLSNNIEYILKTEVLDD